VQVQYRNPFFCDAEERVSAVSEQSERIEHDDAADRNVPESVDGELLLAAMAADTGGPVTDMDLATITRQDKRMALELLRRRLGLRVSEYGGDRAEREAA
jgi:hypothetical protein